MSEKKKLVIYHFHFRDSSCNKSFCLDLKCFENDSKVVDCKNNLIERFEKFFDPDFSTDLQYTTFLGTTKEVNYY